MFDSSTGAIPTTADKGVDAQQGTGYLSSIYISMNREITMTSRNSRIVSSIVLAAAALVSASAFADSGEAFVNQPAVSTKSRADVKNELLQAQRQGYNSSGNFKNYPELAVTSTQTRAEVRAQLASAGNVASSELYSPR